MAGQSLLLDSAGQTCSKSYKIKNLSESKIRSDLFSTPKPNISSSSGLSKWFALRVTYCRELKIQARLLERGIKVFVPMVTRREEKNGKIMTKRVSAVKNLLFAYATQAEIETYMLSEGDKPITHFIWDRATGLPIVVPAKQMRDFMQVCSESADEIIYLSRISDKLRGGAKVRVKSGPFAGVCGTVVRLRKSRRILVEIPGIMAAASTYVPLEDLDVIE